MNINKADGVVFSWQLTKDEFIHLIEEEFPDINNAEEFYKLHEPGIVRYFEKGFSVLVGECGATYETIIRDAINRVLIE